jgi:hypothetical protein
MQLSCHSVATQTKQARKHTQKRNNKKIQYKQYETHEIQVHLLRKLTHITITQQTNKHTHTHTHITRHVKTTTVQNIPNRYSHSVIKYT